MPSADPRPVPTPDREPARGRDQGHDRGHDQGSAGRQLPLVRIGSALAACAVVASAIGRVQYPATALSDATMWATVAVVAAALMLLICLVQAVGWQLLAAGRIGAAPGSGVRQVSIGAHVVSYPVVLIGLFATASVAVAEGAEPSALLLTVVAAVALVAAQAMAAANFVRDSGDGGTVPAHLRRLRAFDRSRRDAPDPLDPEVSGPDVAGPEADRPGSSDRV